MRSQLNFTVIRHIVLIFLILFTSCKSYKQDILFQLDDDFTESDLETAKEQIESNYILEPNDILLLDVFTNKGERIIDPNFELAAQGGAQLQQQQQDFGFVVQADGTVFFPLIGRFEAQGMNLLEAELKLAEEYSNFYIDPFVKLRIGNRRVFVLGAPGGQVVPLQNENTNLTEILALAGGLQLGARAQNIKVIRGDLVYLVDLTTISGMRRTNMDVQPGDVIYIEPWRRPWLETLRDVSPALSLASSILTLIVVVQNLDNR